MFIINRFKYYSSLLLIMVFILIVNCARQLRVPESDSTPPKIKLTIRINGEEIILTEESSPVYRNISESDVILMTAEGTDLDGGIKNVSIGGGTTLDCSDGETGSMLHSDLICQNPDDPETGIGDEAYGIRWTILKLEISDNIDNCPDGFTPVRFEGGLQASAENFHDSIVRTPTFSFRVRF